MSVLRDNVSIDFVELLCFFAIQGNQSDCAYLTDWSNSRSKSSITFSDLHLAMISSIMSPAFFIAWGLITAQVTPEADVQVDSTLFENRPAYLKNQLNLLPEISTFLPVSLQMALGGFALKCIVLWDDSVEFVEWLLTLDLDYDHIRLSDPELTL